MCVIATHPGDKPLTLAHAARMWRSNNDGAGFSYVNDEGRVIVRKAFMKFKEFWVAYSNAIEKYSNSPFVVHFRIRTHGAKDGERTHPFYIGKDTSKPRPALAHNGFVSCVPDHAVKSDTQMLVERFPKLFEDKETLKKAILRGVSDLLGSSSKFAIMYPDKDIVYINKEGGVEDGEGRWYSNSNWDYKYYHDSLDGVAVTDEDNRLLPRNDTAYGGWTRRTSRDYD